MASQIPASLRLPAAEGLQSRFAVHSGIALLAAVTFLLEANLRPTDILDAGLDWQTLLKLGLCGACGLYGCLFADPAKLFKFRVSTLCMTLFAAWATIGVIFAVRPAYSLASCLTLWCMLLFAPAALARLGLRTIVLTGLVTLWVFLAASWVVHQVRPELNGFDPMESREADVQRLGGLAHPNGTGRLAALAIGLTAVALLAGYASWKLVALPTALALLIIVLTGSRTSLMIATAMCGYALWTHLALRGRCVLLGGVAFGAALVALYLAATWDASDRAAARSGLVGVTRSGDIEELHSFTGRYFLWEFCVEKVKEAPLLGYGYGCQRFVIADEHYWPTRHAHNVLLNAVLGTGVVGGLLLLTVLLRQGISLMAAPDYFSDILWLTVVVGGLTENPVFDPIAGGTTLLFLISLHVRPLAEPRSQIA